MLPAGHLNLQKNKNIISQKKGFLWNPFFCKKRGINLK